MSFLEIEIPRNVKTTKANPTNVFFIPSLSNAVTYDVAVGYFTTGWFRDVAEGLAKFAENGGKARFIISPQLNENDFIALKSSHNETDKNRVVKNIISRSYQQLFSQLREDPRIALSWMVYDRILEFKVGVPTNELSGIMHAKIGLFTDKNGKKIAFEGSYNLTHAAQSNWEKISIFCDWKSADQADRVNDVKLDFEEMWEGKDHNLDLYSPSDYQLEPFLNYVEETKRPYKRPKGRENEVPEKFLDPETGKLRPYQEEAISGWFENNGTGIFNMATGSGKTATALAAATKLANHSRKKKSSILFIFVVPYLHLAEQWISESSEFGFDALRCFGAYKDWIRSFTSFKNELISTPGTIRSVVVVNRTFAGDKFQKAISDIDANICLVADEMHNLGAENNIAKLPKHAQFRLGLSATPVRHMDDIGTTALEDYFGKQVIEFTLKDAIDRGYLCKYKYFPQPCSFDDDELEEYISLSKAIARSMGSKNADSEMNEHLKKLLIKRARLIAGAKSKMDLLARLLKDKTDTKHNLVYCGDNIEEDERYVEKVTKLLGNDLKMKVHPFTAMEDKAERRGLLDQFSSGQLQALIAIRCLDEGVDVPKTKTAYILASSTNPRQYIQRRGRVLRRAEGKTFAEIYDFIVVPNLEKIRRADERAYGAERNLLRRELVRVSEFASLAINNGQTLDTLRRIKQKLNLMDM